MSKPCEKCGHCPACGRGGYNVYPYWQWIPPTYRPFGTGDFWYSTTTGDNISISQSRNIC